MVTWNPDGLATAFFRYDAMTTLPERPCRPGILGTTSHYSCVIPTFIETVSLLSISIEHFLLFLLLVLVLVVDV